MNMNVNINMNININYLVSGGDVRQLIGVAAWDPGKLPGINFERQCHLCVCVCVCVCG